MDETGEASQTGAVEERGAVDLGPVVEPAALSEAEPAVEQPTATARPRSRRRLGTIAAVAGLVVVLAGAAYVGASWLGRPRGSAQGGGSSFMVGQSSNGGKTTIKLNMEPAKELPASKPDVMGLLTQRKDNSLFLKTGQVMVGIKKEGSSPAQVSTSADGPVLEVVVTHDTQIYRDDTELGKPPQGGSAETTVQQVVKPGSLDEIKANSVVQVWGEKHGDRTVARVLSYRLLGG